MTDLLALLILMAPFVAGAALAWAAHRSVGLRVGIDQFRLSAPMPGRLYVDSSEVWPTSVSPGDRR